MKRFFAAAAIVLVSAPQQALADECVNTVTFTVKKNVGVLSPNIRDLPENKICTGTYPVEAIPDNKILLMALLKEQRAEIAELKKLITQQKEFQDRLENELLAKQDAERQLVAQQISNIPKLVVMDADLVALLAQKIRELEVQAKADEG